ncbi:hypothetical protein A6J75_005365 [Francisella tularensis]|nr:hypothetical protein A6J75_005365 [Francisella tularensis]ROZ67789.1 hypothetical protein EHF37_05455 [Francisella tularensis]ROZ70562.1 hypothetical protein EGT28_06130 [Francisella tularensis]ROZ73319.1 hypothetical protein EGT35_04255 [Francisella tularensis]
MKNFVMLSLMCLTKYSRINYMWTFFIKSDIYVNGSGLYMYENICCYLCRHRGRNREKLRHLSEIY